MKKLLVLFFLLCSLAHAQVQNLATTTLSYDSDSIKSAQTSGAFIAAGQLLKPDNQGRVIPVTTSDTTGVVGIAVTGAFQTGQTIQTAIYGLVNVAVDSAGTCTPGTVVSISTTVAGFATCAATNNQQIGLAASSIVSGKVSVWLNQLSVKASLAPAQKPQASDAIQYVSPNGNDSNDGLSMGTAKLTPQASINALPSGRGVVIFTPNTYTITNTINVPANVHLGCVEPAAMDTGGAPHPSCVLQEANSANLPAEVVLNGTNSGIEDLSLVGNLANNLTEGVGLLVNKANRVHVSRSNFTGFRSHGIYVNSSAANESCCFKLDHVMSIGNLGDGIFGLDTADGFIVQSEFENNGIPSSLGNPSLVVTVTGTTSVAITSGSLVNDAIQSMYHTWVRIGTAPGCLAQIASQSSSTALTIDRACTNGAGQPMTYGSGVELLESPAWRFADADIGGNQKGFFGSCAGSLQGSGEWMIGGSSQLGNNVEEDIHIEGSTNGCASLSDFHANFNGSSFSPDGVYSQINLRNAPETKIEGTLQSAISPHRNTVPVTISESSGGASADDYINIQGNPANYSISFSVSNSGTQPGVQIVRGGISTSLATKSSAYTLTSTDSWINVTGTTTITVPHALTGQRWDVFNSGSNTVTIQCDSGNINGGASVTRSANTGYTVTADGTNCFAH